MGWGGVRNYILMRSETSASTNACIGGVLLFLSGVGIFLPLRMHVRMHAPDWTIQPTLLPPGEGAGAGEWGWREWMERSEAEASCRGMIHVHVK